MTTLGFRRRPGAGGGAAGDAQSTPARYDVPS
ncbi:MAG: hypothetical protein QOJ52_4443 [Acidimicrobiaceae bacterium]|nr:hypothetical protein [Acidimicrobiaceae bacterium]